LVFHMEKKKLEMLIKSLNLIELLCFGFSVFTIIFLAVLLLLLGEYLYAALAFWGIALIVILLKLEMDKKISSSQWYKVTCVLLPLGLCLSIFLRSITLFFLTLVMYCSQDIEILTQNQENTCFDRRIKFDKAIMLLSCISLGINLALILFR